MQKKYIYVLKFIFANLHLLFANDQQINEKRRVLISELYRSYEMFCKHSFSFVAFLGVHICMFGLEARNWINKEVDKKQFC